MKKSELKEAVENREEKSFGEGSIYEFKVSKIRNLLVISQGKNEVIVHLDEADELGKTISKMY